MIFPSGPPLGAGFTVRPHLTCPRRVGRPGLPRRCVGLREGLRWAMGLVEGRYDSGRGLG